MIPKIMRAMPRIFFLVSFSLKKMALKTATSTIPKDSITEALFTCTPLAYPYTPSSIAENIRPYPTMTFQFRYSLIQLSCFSIALFFKSIWANDATVAVTKKMSSQGVNSLCIRIHQEDSRKDDADSDQIERPDLLAEEENSPKERPAHRKCPVAVCD